MKNEIFHIDEKGYNELPALRSTLLKEFMKSPAHYKFMVDNPNAGGPKSYFILGSFVHSLILEPDTIAGKYMKVNVKSRNATAYKECIPTAKASGRDILLAPEWQQGVDMAQAALGDPVFSKMVSSCEPELSATAKIEDIWVKVRLDMYLPESGIICDVKTTSESVKFFPYNLRKYGYDISAALYWDAMELAGEQPKEFYFAVIEKFPPYGIKLFQMTEEYIEEGRKRYREALVEFKRCLADNMWPSYDNNVPTLLYPPNLGGATGGKQDG